jgi:hypothetical protein
MLGTVLLPARHAQLTQLCSLLLSQSSTGLMRLYALPESEPTTKSSAGDAVISQ